MAGFEKAVVHERLLVARVDVEHLHIKVRVGRAQLGVDVERDPTDQHVIGSERRGRERDASLRGLMKLGSLGSAARRRELCLERKLAPLRIRSRRVTICYR